LYIEVQQLVYKIQQTPELGHSENLEELAH